MTMVWRSRPQQRSAEGDQPESIRHWAAWLLQHREIGTVIDVKDLPVNHQSRNRFHPQLLRLRNSPFGFAKVDLFDGRFQGVSDRVFGRNADRTTSMVEDRFRHCDLT